VNSLHRREGRTRKGIIDFAVVEALSSPLISKVDEKRKSLQTEQSDQYRVQTEMESSDATHSWSINSVNVRV
jgi:hypothetical protein